MFSVRFMPSAIHPAACFVLPVLEHDLTAVEGLVGEIGFEFLFLLWGVRFGRGWRFCILGCFGFRNILLLCRLSAGYGGERYKHSEKQTEQLFVRSFHLFYPPCRMIRDFVLLLILSFLCSIPPVSESPIRISGRSSEGEAVQHILYSQISWCGKMTSLSSADRMRLTAALPISSEG